MVVSPRTNLTIAISATSAGLALSVALFLNHQSANPATVFLAVLLFSGGAVSLWPKTKSEKPEDVENKSVPANPAPGDVQSNDSEPDDFLAQFMKKTETDEVAKTETEDPPKKSEADEFLARFLKK